MDAEKLASTFSIVAFDPESGAIGAAVQSRAFAIGSLCLWGRAGVGAIVTQSFLNVSFGPVGLELLSEGRSPAEAIERFGQLDERMEYRQVAVVDRRGEVSAFTGSRCIPVAADRTGRHFAVQGNVLAGTSVVDAMAEAYASATGSFPRRLLAAVGAGHRTGGDARGSRSAAILVEREGGGRLDFGTRAVDLRVEDHPDPGAELGRLVEIVELQRELGEALQCAVRDGDLPALREARALAERFPAHAEEAWLNIAASEEAAGMRGEARASLARALELEPRLEAIVDHYPNLRLLSRSRKRRPPE